MTKLVTNHHKLHNARQLLESIDEAANTAYYLFLGVHAPREDSTIPDLEDNNRTVLIDTYRNMIMGKRVGKNDGALMIRNIPYESGKVFDMYDDQDGDLFNKDFYCVVDEGSYFHVYKCLDNNLGANSTAEPSFAHVVGSNSAVYVTADGYRWKYMYSFSSAQNVKFSTDEFIPLIPNTDVSDSSVDGAIDVIKIEGRGEGYHNYLVGSFSSGNIRVDGDPRIFEVSNTVASTTNGFYTGCMLYLTTGTGAGQYREVADYFSNSTGKYVVIDSSFDVSPTNGTTYEIYPKVEIIGSGSQTVNAVARALINSHASNSVYRVEMLERGRGYDYAVAHVIANSYVDVIAPAELRPIYGPFKGHGHDAAAELGASRICFSVTLANSEGNTILMTNDFQQVGVLKDPLFSEVVLEFSSANGVFLLEEKASKISPIRINTNVSINTTSTTVECDIAEFTSQVSPGDVLYLKSGDELSHQIVEVNSVTNATHLELVSNGYFACTETIMYLANKSSFGFVQNANSSHVVLYDVAGVIQNGDIIIGESSGAKCIVNAVARSGVEKGFETFIQLYKYVGEMVSGAFEENEIVYQTDVETANATLHSAINDGGTITVYTSNQVGNFATSETINGVLSGAVAFINTKYVPELVFGSGDVLFLENVESITRSDNSRETFRIILEF